MRRNAEYPRRVPKCQKPRNEKKNQNKTKAAELLGVLFALQFCPRRRPAAHFMAIAIPAALA